MKILVTGCAGFIGYSFCKKILDFKTHKIFGVDNLNSYYDVSLKKSRLKILKNYKRIVNYNGLEKILNKTKIKLN